MTINPYSDMEYYQAQYKERLKEIDEYLKRKK